MERVTKYSKIEQGTASRIFFVVDSKEVEYKLTLLKKASFLDFYSDVADGYVWYLCYATSDGKTAISGVYCGGYAGCGTNDFERGDLVDLEKERYEFVTNDIAKIKSNVNAISCILNKAQEQRVADIREGRRAYMDNFGSKELYNENGFVVEVEFPSNFITRPGYHLGIKTPDREGYLFLRDWFTTDGKFLRSKATKIFGENAEAMLRAVKDKSDKIRREVNVLRY